MNQLLKDILQALKNFLCKKRGHRYASPFFSNYTLSFCTCCGKEIAGRTFDDILPRPDDEDYYYGDDYWNAPDE